MEEQNIPVSRPAMMYGLYLGLALVAVSLILFVVDMQDHAYLKYISYVVMAAGIYMASVSFRNNYMDGQISYGKAFSVGIMTVLFASIITSVYTYLYFAFIDQGAFMRALEISEQAMIERGMSDGEIDTGLMWAEKFQKPWLYAVFALIGNIIVGLVITLITSAFVKREDPAADVNI